MLNKVIIIAELRASVNDGSTDAFMWETFMTKPYHDGGVIITIYIHL